MVIDKIITNYSPKLSTFTNLIKGFSANNSAVSKAKEAIKQYLDITDSKQALYDAFISAFGSNPEVCCNKLAGETSFDTANSYGYEISEESASLMLSMFANDDIANILTFTDNNGNPYSFINDSETLIDGCQSLIATQAHPTSTRDLFLYIDQQGKYCINPIIRVAEYYDGEVVAAVTVNNVIESLGILCSIANVSSEYDTIKDHLIALDDALNFHSGDHTILKYIQDFAEFLELNSPNVIGDVVANFHDYAIALMTKLGSTRIKSTSVYSLVNSLVINNEMIDVIRTTYDCIVNTNRGDLVTLLRSYIDGKVEAVRGFANQIIIGFSRSGIYGALSAILDLIKKMFQSTPDNYAVFNTSGSIPQAFSAGFIGIVTGIASTLFNIMSNIMNPIISIIGALGYGVISTVTNIVNANVSEEYARVDDLDLCENSAPYSFGGGTLLLSNATVSAMMDLDCYNDNKEKVKIKELLDWTTLQGCPVLTFSWYGCIVKMAYSDPSIDDDGVLTATKITMNVFPSVCNTESNVFTPTVESHLMDALDHPSVVSLNSSGVGTLDYSGLASYLEGRLFSEILSQFTATLSQDIDYTPVVVNDDSGPLVGYVGAYDSYLKRQVAKNVLLFWVLVYRQCSTSLNSYYAGSGLWSVHVNLVDLVPTVVIDGSETPLLGLLFTSIAHGKHVLNTFNGHQVWVTDATSSYEGLGKIALRMQGVSSVGIPYNFVRTLTTLRYTLINSAVSARPTLSFRASLLDTPYFIPPKYTRGSVITSIVVGALIVVSTAVVVSISAIAIRNKIRKQRSIQQAKVDSAWQDFTKNPTGENYDVYRKTVKANNRFARIFGGTKYDYVNYWNGDVSNRKSVASTEEIISTVFNTQTDTTNDLPVNSVSSVLKLISGLEY